RERRYGVPLLGSEEALKKIGRDEVVKHFRDRLQPGQATVIVAGDLTPAAAKAALEKAFADWKGAAPGSVAAKAAGKAQAGQPAVRTIVDRRGAPQSEMRIGEPSVPRSSPDYFPLLVMNAVLGGQFSSRLNLNLREKHGYTYGARSDFSFRKEGGPFI